MRILCHLRLPTVPPPVVLARGSRVGDLWGFNPPREADLADGGNVSLEVSEDCQPPQARVPNLPDGLCMVGYIWAVLQGPEVMNGDV